MKAIRNILSFDWLLYKEEKPWFFGNINFWFFLAAVFLLYALVYRKKALRNTYLLLISLFFYYKSGGWFVALLLNSSLINYFFGRLLAKVKTQKLKKVSLFLGIAINLFFLFYFKYAYLFTNFVNNLSASEYEVYNWLAYLANSLSGSELNTSSIVLPVGISFFTFQGISYLVDVYRKDCEVVKNYIDLAFFLSFFPQLVAGPIVRASTFIPQLYRKYHLSKQEFGHAIFLIITGLFKKLVISNYLAVNLVDRVFFEPGSYTGVENLLAVYGYGLQIFADFSGYTDIAIGIALLFGFRLPINFNSPYKAASLTEFWHRWHISLSTWLRDYLYIPLGGNRKGKVRKNINLLVTMLLGGLWHGAHLRFLIWGGIHGVGLIIEKLTTKFRIKYLSAKWLKVLGILVTFNLVSVAWVFFRAESLEKVHQIFFQIFHHFSISTIGMWIVAFPLTAIILVGGFVIHWFPARIQEFFRGRFIAASIILKFIIVILLLWLISWFSVVDIQPFIYFKF